MFGKKKLSAKELTALFIAAMVESYEVAWKDFKASNESDILISDERGAVEVFSAGLGDALAWARKNLSEEIFIVISHELPIVLQYESRRGVEIAKMYKMIPEYMSASMKGQDHLESMFAERVLSSDALSTTYADRVKGTLVANDIMMATSAATSTIGALVEKYKITK